MRGEAPELAASLLFARDSRPDAAAVAARAMREGGFSIAAPADRADSGGDADAGGTHPVALLAGDFSFDLVGLAPGAPAPPPPEGAANALAGSVPQAGLEAILLRPARHPTAGERPMAMIRCLALLAAQLASLPELRAVAWHPAGGWASPQHFRASVLRWVEGGMFPGLALASLHLAPDGGLRSQGLALFAGQELDLHPDLARDAGNRARLALRLMHWLVDRGTLQGGERLTGPGGEALLLDPSPDGAVRVRTG